MRAMIVNGWCGVDPLQPLGDVVRSRPASATWETVSPIFYLLLQYVVADVLETF